jgi:hypothetical protein
MSPGYGVWVWVWVWVWWVCPSERSKRKKKIIIPVAPQWLLSELIPPGRP